MEQTVDVLKYCKLDGWSHDSESYIYVLCIERVDDGEIFWYVGETTDIYSRMRSHKYPSGEMSIPTTSGKIVSTHPVEDARFKLRGLERVIDVSDCSDAERRNEERKTAFRVAIEKQTTNVLGGHK
jgi:hypothetical protein